MNIAIDLDKTLFNCNSAIYKFYNKLQQYKKLNKKLVYKTVLDEKESNIGFLKFFSSAFNPDKYEEMTDAISIIKNWKNNGNKITFLSSRPYNIKAVKNSAILWLNKNNVPYDNLVLGCKNKGNFCNKFNIDLLIDDTLANCISACNYGVPAICLTKTEKLTDKRKFEYCNKLFFSDNWNTVNIIATIIQNKKEKDEILLYNNYNEKVCNNFGVLIKDNNLPEFRNIYLTTINNTEKVVVNKSKYSNLRNKNEDIINCEENTPKK